MLFQHDPSEPIGAWRVIDGERRVLCLTLGALAELETAFAAESLGLSSAADGETWRGRVMLDRPASIGRLVAPLASGVCGRLDRGNALEVEMGFGGLSSVGLLALLDGANRLAVRAENGAWEVLGFADAVELAPDRWRLTGLLRGLAGSEDAMLAGAAEGAAVVVLDAAVKALGLGVEEAGRPLSWLAEQAGGAARPFGPIVFAGGLRAQTPLSPVHLRAGRRAGGIGISWVRRGRVDADDWQASDIPLDEAEERYRVEILDGGVAIRSVEVTDAAFLYSPEQEISDFGAAQAALAVRIRQVGRKVALGLPAERVFAL